MTGKNWWEETPQEFAQGFSEEVQVHHDRKRVNDMAELERIDITHTGTFYRVLATEDKQSGRSIQDTHLFLPSELLELAAWIEQNRAQLEQEAQDMPKA